MPNITGGLDMGSGTAGAGKGLAFIRTNSGAGALSTQNSGYYNLAGASGTSDWSRSFRLNASLSSPIHGNSTTVTPLSQSVLYILKY